MQSYQVRVTKDYLVFCSGHFITYYGNECERLHGHNYRVAVEMEGPLDPNWYVFDFIALKKTAMSIVNELDHRMLVAMKNPLLHVDADEVRVRIRFQHKEWIFPREDCVLLDIENTTAELLAKWFAEKLLDTLKATANYTPEVMRVEVEESFGQVATYQIDLGVQN